MNEWPLTQAWKCWARRSGKPELVRWRQLYPEVFDGVQSIRELERVPTPVSESDWARADRLQRTLVDLAQSGSEGASLT